ncbi:MAG: deoxyribodipyrimidine photolyase, partial [Flavobacteriales bacterium]|nr:deoxyribodipyrimidine photolyase [Flavobacteriales bacterium]
MKNSINIVWLKRDLRLQDQKAFNEAELSGCPYIPIYIIEPSALNIADYSERHLQFVYHSVQDMNKTLESFNRKVYLLYGEALAV